MKRAEGPTAAAQAAATRSWDRNRILFDIVEQGQPVACAISREALQELCDQRYAKPAELMQAFDRLRDRIESIARMKYRARPSAVEGTLTIWSGDLEEDAQT